MYSGIQIFAGAAVVLLALGVLGLRWRSARLALVVLTPTYSIAVLLYFLVAGAGGTCDGEGATFRCWEVSYASTWDWLASLQVGAVMLSSASPIVSAWLRNRVPSILGSVVLLALIAINPLGLWIWFPALAGTVAAAIAGPPSRARTVAGDES